MLRQRLSLCLVLTVWLVSNSGSVQMVRAQNQTGTTTQPEEARALNTIFKAWNITAIPSWNISGELCSGDAVNDGVTLESKDHNPFIKCNCYFENGTICRIVALKVQSMDVKGSIPEELWTLVYITSLNLNQNFLTGPLSPRIGNLNLMQWMTFGANALSGPVPKEIGLLTDLRSLALDMNSFSGSIPAEIGKCTRLQKIYIASSGLTGEIPSSFANLVDIEEAWMNDIQLTGQIPEFIGKWTKLSALRILGTNLSGPIPSSFANLISLTELRLSDISNSNSSLKFIRDMKSLSVLVLRNNNLMGTIPSDIGEYVHLRELDLSFNNLTGKFPPSLFNSRQLTHLFLGNNNFNGSLPTQNSLSLCNIDVSYNDLAGSLPSWVSLPNLQLNLIANYFTLGDSDRRVFAGLDCLQKNFPCNRGKGIYFNFSVNCGGPEIRSTSGALYEEDQEALGPASFFVSKAKRWAVSNVGLFTGSNTNQYIALSTKQFANTSDSELFQSARLSASSLRYYGLGLENGGYTVTIQFSEIQIQGSNTWRSLGRRVFDIYVQGKLVEKDFDMHATANHSKVQGVQRTYKANDEDIGSSRPDPDEQYAPASTTRLTELFPTPRNVPEEVQKATASYARPDDVISGIHKSWNHTNTSSDQEDIQDQIRRLLDLPYLEAHGLSGLQTYVWRPGVRATSPWALVYTLFPLSVVLSQLGFPTKVFNEVNQGPLQEKENMARPTFFLVFYLSSFDQASLWPIFKLCNPSTLAI